MLVLLANKDQEHNMSTTPYTEPQKPVAEWTKAERHEFKMARRAQWNAATPNFSSITIAKVI